MNSSKTSSSQPEFSQLCLEERQKIVIKQLQQFTSPQELSDFLIKSGKKLTIQPKDSFSENERVRGCQSLLFCKVSLSRDHKVSLHIFSDALLSRGLAYIVHQLFEGCHLKDLLLFKPEITEKVDLLAKLSIGRSQGLSALLKAITPRALAAMKS